MISGIFNILPDWALGIVFALLVWFGLHYFWFAPQFFTNQKVVPDGPCNITHVMRYGAPHKTDMALYTASFGNIGSVRAILLAICADAPR